jgi:hypothetical protein
MHKIVSAAGNNFKTPQLDIQQWQSYASVNNVFYGSRKCLSNLFYYLRQKAM